MNIALTGVTIFTSLIPAPSRVYASEILILMAFQHHLHETVTKIHWLEFVVGDCVLYNSQLSDFSSDSLSHTVDILNSSGSL